MECPTPENCRPIRDNDASVIIRREKALMGASACVTSLLRMATTPVIGYVITAGSGRCHEGPSPSCQQQTLHQRPSWPGTLLSFAATSAKSRLGARNSGRRHAHCRARPRGRCLPDSTEVWAHAVVERIEEWWGGRKETVLYSNMQDNTDKRRYRQHSSKTMHGFNRTCNRHDRSHCLVN